MELDLDTMYDMCGDLVTYTSPGGAVTSAKAIFAAPGGVVFDTGVMLQSPSMRYRTAVFAGVVKQGIWTLSSGRQYRVSTPPKGIADGSEAYVEMEGA
jgi:hypothetical protein